VSLGAGLLALLSMLGNAMTFKVLNDETQKVLCRSNIRSALVHGEQNLRVDPIGGEEPPFVKLCSDATTHRPFDPGGSPIPISSQPEEKGETNTSQPLRFHPTNLIGWTFLLDPREDGQRFRARIVQAIQDQDTKLTANAERFKFWCSINDNQFEEILSYSAIFNYIEQQDDHGTRLWQFQRITGHEGPLLPTDPYYQGSAFNITIEWKMGR